jgi:hypothetical protein
MKQRTTGSDRAEPNLLRDEGGATMVMGVFMAVLLVGLIYYVMGIGEAVMYRQEMQDAADSGAFAAAVMHARAMNLVSLLNIVIASIVAVIVALQVALFILEMALGIALAICAGCGPHCSYCCSVCVSDVPSLAQGVSDVSGQLDFVEALGGQIMTASHATQSALASQIPIASQAKVAELGSETFHEPTDSGFIVSSGLPIAPDDGVVCDKAVPYAQQFVPIAILGRPVGAFVPAWTSLVTALVTPFAGEFCDGEHGHTIADDTAMGGEPFQIRAFMAGSPDFFGWTRTGVGVASWGREDAVETHQDMQVLSHFSFAQAEFYFDGDETDPKEWLWHMSWTARLRRFRSPQETFDEICGSLPHGCGGLEDLGEMGQAVVH